MEKMPLPETINIYDTPCPIIYAMQIIGKKWILPILWYIGDSPDCVMRFKKLEKKIIGITATALTKCLRELEADGLIQRKQYETIPPAVEYKLTDNGKELLAALDPIYLWAEKQINEKC